MYVCIDVFTYTHTRRYTHTFIHIIIYKLYYFGTRELFYSKRSNGKPNS